MRKGGELVMGPHTALDQQTLLVVLLGASAVGKSATAEQLCEQDIAIATPTWTTRPKRSGEIEQSYDHHFVSALEFEQQHKKGGFMDEHTFYGARYGLPFPQQPTGQKIALLVLKPVFMPLLLQYYPRARIYQIDAPLDLVHHRMEKRLQTPADIAIRMQKHAEETAQAQHYAHVVFRNDGKRADIVRKVRRQIAIDKRLLLFDRPE